MRSQTLSREQGRRAFLRSADIAYATLCSQLLPAVKFEAGRADPDFRPMSQNYSAESLC